jgi:pSer/pThr/pTyr-binding forkhead associated (FHA) protein
MAAENGWAGRSVHYRVRSQERSALLGEGELVIGRSPYCSLVLDHETLSRVHATLRIVGDGVELDDLDSSNGTFVNGARIQGPTVVKPGDEIRLGKVMVALEEQEARAPAETGQLPALRLDDTGSAITGAEARRT